MTVIEYIAIPGEITRCSCDSRRAEIVASPENRLLMLVRETHDDDCPELLTRLTDPFELGMLTRCERANS